jgi:hypothetical protein
VSTFDKEVLVPASNHERKKEAFLRCPTGLTHPTTGLLIDGRGYYETLDPPLGTLGREN